jgi:hypothetical protein
LKTGRYSNIITIQNASGHGIDIVAWDKRIGDWVFFEVKASKTVVAPGLSKLQKNSDRFIMSRLRRAAGEAGSKSWKSVSETTKAEADNILKAIKKSPNGIKDYKRELIEVTKVWTSPPTITRSPW